MFAHATDCYRPTQLRTACTTNSPDQACSHWRERQRAQTILWLSEGKTVAEVAALQERIPETIRLQRRHWEL